MALDTLDRGAQKRARVNTRNALIIGGLVGAAVAAAVAVAVVARAHTRDSYNYTARYVVIFDHAIADDSTATQFKAFLNDPNRQKSNTDLTLTFAGAKPSSIPDMPPPADAIAVGPPIFLHVPAPGQTSSPNTLHVTQKVGLFTPQDLAELLKTVQIP